MEAFLKKLGTSLAKESLIEILNAEEDLFGDFIIVKGYMFKKTYGQYSCMETPTEIHKKIKKHWAKAPGDYYKK
jgi:hypothetical protein